MPRAPLCPFYGRAKKEQLVCLMGGADTTGTDELMMNFPNRSCRLHYWVSYCCGNWKNCTLAASLWEEYELAASQTAKSRAKGSSENVSKKHRKPFS